MMKYRLVTPGPAMVPEETLLELAKPVRHHRTKENQALVAEAMTSLKRVFLTHHDVVILTSSGTGAMESAVANIVKPGDKTIVMSAGKWGERWIELNKAYQANVVLIQEEYGKAIPPARLEEALHQNPDAVAVYGTLCDTSTAVGHDVAAMGALVAKTPALFAVDGISGVAAMECRVDDWNIDMLAVGSQKALMMPPGLAFLTISAKAKQVIEQTNLPNYYFDMKKALKAAAQNDTPFTPAHTLIGALVQSLRLLLADGMEKVWERTATMSRAMLTAADALGVRSLAERPSTALTALVAPPNVDGSAWEKLLEKKYGVKVAGGQGSLKGKIIRVAHMGYVDALDVIGIVAALEWSLAELGHAVEPGKAVAAATRVFAAAMAGK